MLPVNGALCFEFYGFMGNATALCDVSVIGRIHVSSNIMVEISLFAQNSYFSVSWGTGL